MTSLACQSVRRRRTLRSLGLYVGICWLTIQVAGIVLGAFSAPSWMLRGLIVVAVAGAPVIAALSWFARAASPGSRSASDPPDSSDHAPDGRRLGFAAIGILTVALAFSVYLNLVKSPEATAEIEPVTALITDFENGTGEAVFDGVLEQLMTLNLQVVPYIALFDRAQAEDLAATIDANESGLTTEAARLIAVRQDIDIVLDGSIERSDAGYRMRVAGLAPITGEKMFEFSSSVAQKDRVPEALAALTRDVSEAIGGERAGDPMYAYERGGKGYPVTSIEAAELYADANRLDAEGDFAAASDLYRKAAELQPDWVAVYGGWAISEFNRGRIEEAEKLFDRALSLIGDSSEADRLFYLGSYFMLIRDDYENALETMSEYVELIPGSAAGHNNLAVAAFYTLDFDRAKQEGQRLVDLFPKDSLYGSNLALYAMYASDFETATERARDVLENDPDYGGAYLPLAIAALEDGDPDSALSYYDRMAATDAGVRVGGSQTVAVVGIADTEMYSGKFDQARRELRERIDRAEQEGAAVPVLWQMLLAEIHGTSGDRGAAIEAVRTAQALSGLTSIKVAGALILAAAGELEAVDAVADELSGQLSAQSRAYGLMLQATVSRERAEYAAAIERLRSALELADLWRLRLELGRTFLEFGNFADALAEFERCRERRGEAAAIFLDDVPTYRYLAELPYWMARAQTGLGMDDAAAENYAAFLSLRPEGGAYVEDARARLER